MGTKLWNMFFDSPYEPLTTEEWLLFAVACFFLVFIAVIGIGGTGHILYQLFWLRTTKPGPGEPPVEKGP